jgi:hypothetical protein
LPISEGDAAPRIALKLADFLSAGDRAVSSGRPSDAASWVLDALWGGRAPQRYA